MKISILTPSYNSGQFIERAIKSVLNQDFKNWEHIIVDGGSSEETINILKKYKHLIWISEKDKGQSDAMNKAFKLSNGDIIVYLNADDEFDKDIFQIVVDQFSRNKKLSFLIGNLRIQTKNNNRIHYPSTKLRSIIDYCGLKFPLNPVSYFYKREVQEKIGNFPLDNHYSMDYWFLLRAYMYFKISKIDITFGTFYFHELNKSSEGERAQTSLKNDFINFQNENYLLTKILLLNLNINRIYKFILKPFYYMIHNRTVYLNKISSKFKIKNDKKFTQL